MIEKKILINELFVSVSDYLIMRFFDTDSDELLDEKIEVLSALKNGIVPADIPKYYDVLELMPDDETHWD